MVEGRRPPCATLSHCCAGSGSVVGFHYRVPPTAGSVMALERLTCGAPCLVQGLVDPMEGTIVEDAAGSDDEEASAVSTQERPSSGVIRLTVLVGAALLLYYLRGAAGVVNGALTASNLLCSPSVSPRRQPNPYPRPCLHRPMRARRRAWRDMEQ
jgi:hypothetical protein